MESHNTTWISTVTGTGTTWTFSIVKEIFTHKKLNVLPREVYKTEKGYFKVFKENALKEIAHKAIKKKTGARGLRSILENILLKTMFDLPSQDNVEEVIIDANTVKGHSNPIIVHSKNTKSKIEKTTAA